MATKKKKAAAKAAPMTKSQLINALVEANDMSRKQIKEVLDALNATAYKQLKRVGVFTVPGFAKFTVVRKPATKARKGINPFTGEPTIFKAKPARKSVRARPIKAIKDAVA
jgi:DNA-binding protein HU-beta